MKALVTREMSRMDKYEELRQAVIEYLRLPTNVTRREMAKLVGEPYDEPIEGAFLAARGALKWEEGNEAPEDAIRRLRDNDDSLKAIIRLMGYHD